MLRTTFSVALLSVGAAAVDVNAVSIGKFKITNPAFLEVEQFTGSDPFLLTTSFGMFSSGKIHVTTNITAAIQKQDLSLLKPVTLDTPSFLWPNFAKIVPESVFNERVIVVPDGFLPPGKTNGGIYLVQIDNSDVTKT